MLGATHLLVGASIYGTLRNNSDSKYSQGIFNSLNHGAFEPLVYSLAFTSHFLLDAIPHYELSLAWNYTLGVLSGLIVAYTTLKRKHLGLLMAGFLGGLPDIIWLTGLSPSFDRIHHFLHFTSSTVIPAYLLIIELILCFWSIGILIKKRR